MMIDSTCSPRDAAQNKSRAHRMSGRTNTELASGYTPLYTCRSPPERRLRWVGVHRVGSTHPGDISVEGLSWRSIYRLVLRQAAARLRFVMGVGGGGGRVAAREPRPCSLPPQNRGNDRSNHQPKKMSLVPPRAWRRHPCYRRAAALCTLCQTGTFYAR